MIVYQMTDPGQPCTKMSVCGQIQAHEQLIMCMALIYPESDTQDSGKSCVSFLRTDLLIHKSYGSKALFRARVDKNVYELSKN